MIRNIVFDFGNVLVQFKPELYLRKFTVSEKEALEIKDLIWLSAPWKDGDKGLKSRSEILNCLCEQFPEKKDLLEKILPICSSWLNVPENLPPFLDKLDDAGYALYYISNTNREDFEYMMGASAMMRSLKGGIASFKEGVLKPSPEIFTLFLDRFGLKADECLFIDDMAVNTEAARSVGFHTLTLTGGAHTLPEALSKYFADTVSNDVSYNNPL